MPCGAGETSDGEEAVRRARETRADVVLMDSGCPAWTGVAATRRIAEDEDLGGKVPVLTTYEADAVGYTALRAGRAGSWSRTPSPRPDPGAASGRPR